MVCKSCHVRVHINDDLNIEENLNVERGLTKKKEEIE